MAAGVEHLLAEGVISEVLTKLQSGKEAEVYVVRFGGKVVAAKVYKDRATRSFKNNAAYKEGRAVRNSRSQRAIDRGSRFGKAAAEDAWKSAEADALYKLHAADVRVPTPVLYLDGVLLMELVMGADGNAAPRLIDTDLTVAQANAAYHDMVGQLVRILSCDLIHGDLSPYNVLWGAEGPVIIDFPQIVSASHNSGSEQFFLRDADNILGHFARIDRSLFARRGDPREIWNAYRRRELTPDFRPTGQHRPPPRTFERPGGAPSHAPPGVGRESRSPSTGHGGRPERHPRPLQNDPQRPPQNDRRPRVPQAAQGGVHRGMRMPEVIVRHAVPAPGGPPRDTPERREAPPRPSPPQGTSPAAPPAEGAPRPRRRRRRR